MKKFYCNGKEDFCDRDHVHDCGSCEHLDGNGGEEREVEGEWEVVSDEYEICADEFVCSICKESFVSSDLTDEQFLQMMKYCPNCGAKMKGGAE